MENKAKTKVGNAAVESVVVPVRHTAVPRPAVPTATTGHAERAR